MVKKKARENVYFTVSQKKESQTLSIVTQSRINIFQ